MVSNREVNFNQMEIPKSTVRFAQVVKECGRPEPITLWTDPKKDRNFQAAARDNRVMTVVQETVGTRKDFGVVGFYQAEHASYLAFPKSLDRFKGKRVIGIKYDLLNVPKSEDPVKPTAEPAKKAAPSHVVKAIKQATKKPPTERKTEATKPKLHRFRVTIRSTATVDVERELEAKTAKQARQMAVEMADQAVEFPAETITRKVVGVRRSAKT